MLNESLGMYTSNHLVLMACLIALEYLEIHVNLWRNELRRRIKGTEG